MVELIITEKPSAMKHIAEALADKKPKKEKGSGKVSYYSLTHKGKEIYVGCAVGHLYNLQEKNKKGWTYPVFDVEWIESYKIGKNSEFTKQYLETLKSLIKKSDEFYNACDYDLEGETIFNVILEKEIKRKDAKRMKFSAMTKEELLNAFEKPMLHIDKNMAEAGRTRHLVDYYFGINLSRALTLAIKHATNRFKILSSGRVQGPALKILALREIEIKKFKSEPYWELEALGDVNSKHKEGSFWKENEVKKIHEKIKHEKSALVKSIEKAEFKQDPPNPFDLTALQLEAYRALKITPKETLEIAQELYTAAYISYPRTSSNQLPPSINIKKILQDLSKQEEYKSLCEELLKLNKTVPNNGKKSDPAHPAIHPTGTSPKKLGERQKKIYDLIVRRVLSSLSDPATRETQTIELLIKEEPFITKGTRTVEPGWHKFYGRFNPNKEEELPKLKLDEKVKLKKIDLLAKETQPPKRYTPASIIKEMEKKGLGTKCVVGNTSIKINSDNQVHTEKISKIFEKLHNKLITGEDGGNIELALNDKKHCFSFDRGHEMRSIFKFVSRRKLSKGEKIYRINYLDGSYVDVTEKHPILIFENGNKKYISANQLKEGMRSVTSVKFPEKIGDLICGWEGFIKLCTLKTKIYGISDEIFRIRDNQNLTQRGFGEKYGITQSEVCRYEKSKFIPLCLFKKMELSEPKEVYSNNKEFLIKNPFPLRMKSSLTRILGNLVGDCSIDKEKIKKENCYDFRYHNTNQNLINRFIRDIETTFGVTLVVKKAKPKQGHLQKYYIRIPAIIGRIMFTLFPQVTEKNAADIPEKFYPEFIGALFDDEGHTIKNEPKLFISNTNFKLLRKLKSMLFALNINSTLDEKQFKLYIRGRDNLEKFLEKIPIHSIKKKQRLINHLSRFYKYGTHISSIEKQSLVISALNQTKNKELTSKRISKKLKFDIPRTRHHLKLLIKDGYIEKIVRGISEYPRKKISYRLIKPVEETFFKYIGEKVIAPDFITKKIQSVKPIKYNGFVY
ncbi:DNA topoisomerase I, partial [Candidatus Woesearchaeota archaeon]|nr:DNA topoisomerase I [Candidatus Woesearchaeota archaeon]